MANKYKAETDLDFNGKSYVARFTMNDLADLEDFTGMTINEIFSENRMGIKVIRELLFLAIRRTEKGRVSREQVGESMDPGLLEYYGTQIGKALTLAMGGEEEPEEAAPLEIPKAVAG